MSAAGAAAPAAVGAAAPRRVRRLHRRAREQAETLLALAAGEEAALVRPAAGVSRWSVAQHLAHLVLVDRTALDRLDRALAPPVPPPVPKNGSEPQPKPQPARPGGLTPAGRLILGLGYIPRGLGRAPDPYQPEIASLAALRADLADVRDRIEAHGGRLGELSAAKARFRHFLFGELTAVQWLRFLGVHHHHHLKIIRDIQRAQRRPPRNARRQGRAGEGA